jgi:hypothetical protein
MWPVHVAGHGLDDGVELADEKVAAVRRALVGEIAVRGVEEREAGVGQGPVAVPAHEGDERADAVGEDEAFVVVAVVGDEEDVEQGERVDDLRCWSVRLHR